MELRLGWDEREMVDSIVSVRPLRYAYEKIAILVVSTVVMTVVSVIVLAKLAALPFLVLSFFIIYLKLNNHYLFQYLFFDVSEENTPEILHYAIRDLSFISQAQQYQNSRKSNKVYIVKVHHILKQVKYFHFKEELYKVREDTVSRVSQIDRLDILEIDNIQEYAETGLSAEKITKSLSLFGEQKQYLNPTRKDFVIKRVAQEKELVLINLLLLLIAIFVVQSLLVSITLLLIDAVVMFIIVLEEGPKVQKFHENFKAISDKTFLVFRSGQFIRVSYSQIVVGDIIEIERADNEEYLVCFKSLIRADFQIICKQGIDKEQTFKKPIRELSSMRQDPSRYTLHALSHIESASLKGRERLIVLQNNSISKFFSLWFQKARYMEFQTISKDNSFRVAQIFAIGAGLLIIVDLIISIATKSITRPYNAQTFTDILFITFIVPAILHLLFTLNHQKSMQELQAQNIDAFGVNIAQAGYISNIVMDFSELLQIQFQQVLYKNIIFDPSNRQFQPDRITLQNGKTYESLLAVIFYISIGYFDLQDGKSTLLSDVFTTYADYFEYEDRIDSGKTIVHKESDKRWTMVGRDPENQKGARSWRIQYENNVKYCITECNVKNEGNFISYIGKEDQNRLNTYIELAEGLIEEGKQLKLILFKNYKKDGLRGTSALEQQMQQFVGRDREELEKDMQFAAFIVFDNALKLENSASIEFLRDIQGPSGKTFNIFIYSESRDANLAGFEHILQYIPIHYSFKAPEKTAFVRQKMSKSGTLVFGRDIGDQYGQLQADIAMKRIADDAKDGFQLPTDVFINKIEDIQIILEVGNFCANYRLQAAKYISSVWFWMIFGWLWIGARGQTKEISNSTFWVICLMLLLVFAPLALKNQYFFERTLKYYGRSLKILTMNYVFQLILNVVISIIILTVVSQQKLCEQANAQDKTNIIMLRKGSQQAVWNCINLPLLLGGSASNIAFVIFYEENNPSQTLEWWRFCLPAVWLVMMIIARFPLKLILLCLTIMIFLILLKLLVKAIEPKEPTLEKAPIQLDTESSD